jgi:hypothetical protein
MSANLEYLHDNSYQLCVTGELKKAELDAVQSEFAQYLADAGAIRLLVLLKNFTGWEKNAAWDDTNFFFSHGDKLEKIAVVGNSRWEAEVLAFMGAGIRKGPVKFFPETAEPDARAWLSE